MKRERIVYFDVLNVLACICVIGMHCNGLTHQYSDTAVWRQSLMVDVLAYWAVPVFVMLSGANLMTYRSRYTTAAFLKKRLTKILVPLAVWSGIFYGWALFRGNMTWNGIRDFIETLLNFRIVGVYWFFAPLLMVYLSIPVLSKLKDDTRLLWYMVFLGFLSYGVLPFLCTLFGIAYQSNFSFPLMGGYVIFALLGYLLHQTELPVGGRVGLYLLGIIGAATRYFHTVYATVRDGAINKLTWNYENWPSVLLAVAIFVLFKYACRHPFFQKAWFVRLVGWLSGASFGIYLIHVFVMNHLASLLSINIASGWWRIFAAPTVYLISLLTVKLLQKIPRLGAYLFP